jgi:hypothetical protein
MPCPKISRCEQLTRFNSLRQGSFDSENLRSGQAHVEALGPDIMLEGRRLISLTGSQTSPILKGSNHPSILELTECEFRIYLNL